MNNESSNFESDSFSKQEMVILQWFDLGFWEATFSGLYVNFLIH